MPPHTIVRTEAFCARPLRWRFQEWSVWIWIYPVYLLMVNFRRAPPRLRKPQADIFSKWNRLTLTRSSGSFAGKHCRSARSGPSPVINDSRFAHRSTAVYSMNHWKNSGTLGANPWTGECSSSSSPKHASLRGRQMGRYFGPDIFWPGADTARSIPDQQHPHPSQMPCTLDLLAKFSILRCWKNYKAGSAHPTIQ